MKNKIVAILTLASLAVGFAANAQVATSAKAQQQLLLRAKEAREKVLGDIKAEREAFQAKIQVAKQSVQERLKAEENSIRTQLQNVKDQKKRNTVETLDKNMNSLNGKFADTWSKALLKLDDHLTRIVNLASTTAAKGGDVSSVNTAVDAARIAISAAKTALTAQSQKVYSVTVTTEDKLKADVSATRTQLNNDLKSVKDLVEKARKAVVNALTTLNKVRQTLKASSATTTENQQ